MAGMIFDRSKTSVIVIDMVNDALKAEGAYLNTLGMKYADHEPLIRNNRRLIEAARSVHVPVIFTRTARKQSERKYLDHFVPPVGQRTQTHGVETFIEGTWGDEIIDEFKPLPTEHIIDKKRRSAFLYTPLDLILRSTGITTLIVTGIGTPGCVESTVRAGFDLDYYIVIPRECTSSALGREARDTALIHMGKHCAVVTPTDRLLVAITSAAPVPLLSLQIPDFQQGMDGQVWSN